jgi:hypothetical protein
MASFGLLVPRLYGPVYINGKTPSADRAFFGSSKLKAFLE